MSHAIGIDLGTVYSCVATVIDGQVVVIPDEDGELTQPSVFAMSASREVLIGRKAQAQQNANQLNTIFAIKRLIGLKYDSEEVTLARSKLPYKIIRAENGDAWVEVDGKPMSPEEISAQILVHMKKIAENYLGEKVRRAVITVPAHFNDSQRQATRDAGRIAGLDVMRIINEPTAAALAFGMDKAREKERSANVDSDRVIGVFDLGGGTFDISFLEMRQGTFKVLSTHGDCYLGGEDFDLEIVAYLIQQGKKTMGVDLSQDKLAIQRMKVAAQHAKHELSDKLEVTIDLPYISRGMKHLQVKLTRNELNRCVEPVMKRIELPCLSAMEDAELLPRDITDVVLVGGQTRMPAIKNYCKSIFGSVPRDDINPDEAVAIGAALQAALLDGLIEGVKFQDVLPLSLGLEIQGGLTSTIIPRNTRVPAKVTRVFTTSAPLQSKVTVHILQGESKFAPNNETLGRIELAGIPPAPRGYPEIGITFSVDESGIITVAAQDLDTGDEKHIEIVASSGLDDKALDDLIRQSHIREDQEDRQKKREMGETVVVEEEPIDQSVPTELRQARDKLKALLYTTQVTLDTQGTRYKGAKRKLLEEALKTARAHLDICVNPGELLSLQEQLSKEAHQLQEFVATPWA